jgi:alpha-amylase
MNRLKRTALATSLALGLASSVQAAPTTFVHLFEWKWTDVALECEQYLGPKGYAAVQVSPPNEHIQGDTWWTRYQPVSYIIQSRGGDRTQFIDMVNRCNAVGVEIYVDSVINHMAFGSGTAVAGSTYGNNNFPNYSPQDFHQPACGINPEDYGTDRWRVQNCGLPGLPDLDTGTDYVRTTLANYLNDLTNIGVAGFRFDASKHMSVADIQGVMAKVNGNPLVFQEVIDQGGEVITASEYQASGLVTEFKYTTEIGNTFRNGKLSWLSNFGEGWGMLPSSSAIVFVDNHDNQRGHGGGGNVITHKDGTLYDLANVFMLTFPYGYPKVMSSYEFGDDTETKGPTVDVHNNGNLECFGNNWKCEHRWGPIVGAMDFRNNTSDHFATTNWWDNGNNQIAFGRSNLGHMALNKEGSTMNATINTDMAEGIYCNVLKGELAADGQSCSGETITVNADGTINLNIAGEDAMAIHHNAKVNIIIELPVMQRTVIFIQAQTAAGQDMFIRGGIDHDYANNNLGRNCQTTNFECGIAIEHNNTLNATTAPWKTGESYLDWYGSEATQSNEAEGTPMDWTTNVWPGDWGTKRTVAADGYGETPLNIWGQHYWMLDVDMDCSQTVNGQFEVKAYVKNGQGWEGNINQANIPYASSNHVATCGKINKFDFNGSSVEVRDF